MTHWNPIDRRRHVTSGSVWSLRSKRERLAADARPGGGGRPASPSPLHLAVDGRRARPDRHVRHEAGPRERRRVQGNRHQCARRAIQRASAAAGQTCRPVGDHSQPHDERRRPRTRFIFDADRPASDGSGQLSVARFVSGEGTGARRRQTAAVRQHFAEPRAGAGRIRPGFSRAEVRAARGRREQPAGGCRWRNQRSCNKCHIRRFESRRDQTARRA